MKAQTMWILAVGLGLGLLPATAQAEGAGCCPLKAMAAKKGCSGESEAAQPATDSVVALMKAGKERHGQTVKLRALVHGSAEDGTLMVVDMGEKTCTPGCEPKAMRVKLPEGQTAPEAKSEILIIGPVEAESESVTIAASEIVTGADAIKERLAQM